MGDRTSGDNPRKQNRQISVSVGKRAQPEFLTESRLEFSGNSHEPTVEEASRLRGRVQKILLDRSSESLHSPKKRKEGAGTRKAGPREADQPCNPLDGRRILHETRLPLVRADFEPDQSLP